MPDSTLLTYGVGYIVLLTAICAPTFRRVFKRHSWSGAIPLLLLRLAAMGVLIRLVWVAFFLYSSETSKAEQKQPRRLVVLRDESRSMEFKSGNSSRAELARKLSSMCRDVAAGRDDVVVQELLFGGNVVERGQARQLATDATLLGPALARTLMRYRPDVLVVASDGAATDGAPPSYLLKWLRNRNVPVFAVTACNAMDTNRDRYVESVRCVSNNPEEIHARVSSTNAGTSMSVRLLIDDKERGVRPAEGGKPVDLSFPVPRLDDGWHEFRVEIEAANGEITLKNNVGLGVFRVAASRKILFLYASPRMEYRHLVRFLRQMYPRRIEALAVNDPKAAKLKVDSYLMVIAGDLQLADCPASVRKLFTKPKIPIMIMTGRHLDKWTRDMYPDGLVTRVVGHRNLYADRRKPAHVIVAAENTHPDFRDAEFRPLELYHFDEVQLAPGATPIYAVTWDNSVRPLMLADRLDQPRLMYLLSDTTWRWGLSPDNRVRSAYRGFWRQTFRWVLGAPSGQYHLDLGFEDSEAGSNIGTFSVVHTNERTTPDLTTVRVKAGEQELRTVLMGKDEASTWSASWNMPKERPQIVWAQGTAELSGRRVQSERRPFLLQLRSRELVDALPRPDVMKALASDKEHYAYASESVHMKRLLVKALAPKENQRFVRRRDRRHELILASIFVLLIASEWWLERYLKERLS